jgi:hypothetical protein
MGYSITKGNRTRPLRFVLTLSSDHLTGATGKVPTVLIAKNDGLGFQSPVGVITEVGNGAYQVAAVPDDANVPGPISLRATAAACDPCDADFLVVNYTV